MPVFRVCARKHAASALSGEGARLAGGRWNPRGLPAVYAAGSRSLAILEAFVHFDPEESPSDLVIVPVEIPNGLARVRRSARELPRNWRDFPAPGVLQELGGAWLRKRETAVLVVPSAIVPEEEIFILNPLHPDTGAIKARKPQPFAFDRRMFK